MFFDIRKKPKIGIDCVWILAYPTQNKQTTMNTYIRSGIPILGITFFASLFFSCGGPSEEKKEIVSEPTERVLSNRVLSAEEQAKLTPTVVIDILKEGNLEFRESKLTVRNTSPRVREVTMSQYPKAIVLSCMDQGAPVEDIFQRGIGDIFEVRVGGYVVNPDIVGSMEYACKVSGSKVIMVMGHQNCRTIKSAIDELQMGNFTPLLAKIKPAVIAASQNFDGEQTSANPAFVQAVCLQNVERSIQEIRENSSLLREMEAKGEIKIVGAMFEVKTGKVTFLGDEYNEEEA